MAIAQAQKGARAAIAQPTLVSPNAILSSNAFYRPEPPTSHQRRLHVSSTLVPGSHSVGAVAAEAVDSSGPSNNFAAVQSSPRYEMLTAGAQRNALPVDNQRNVRPRTSCGPAERAADVPKGRALASCHNHHVFVVIMDMAHSTVLFDCRSKMPSGSHPPRRRRSHQLLVLLGP